MLGLPDHPYGFAARLIGAPTVFLWHPERLAYWALLYQQVPADTPLFDGILGVATVGIHRRFPYEFDVEPGPWE